MVKMNDFARDSYRHAWKKLKRFDFKLRKPFMDKRFWVAIKVKENITDYRR
ncbi:hypothetical protein IID22_02740 [Patescibacteria group bacterium]|nr:hypothetical protein [Patescibacteria group bacterium]